MIRGVASQSKYKIVNAWPGDEIDCLEGEDNTEIAGHELSDISVVPLQSNSNDIGGTSNSDSTKDNSNDVIGNINNNIMY
jgi:hypothetical protein